MKSMSQTPLRKGDYAANDKLFLPQNGDQEH